MAKPLLSIGIIFKNEIRCLERCLKSLQPLREAIPCELVMADTGADDGSREIAEQYADILFDFPWINDFSAARNAVMDRCSGCWFMSIDCDEWVDTNIQGFVSFLTTNQNYDFGSVIIRNYNTLQLDKGTYGDFLAVRLLRMSTGIRYEGIIHEHWPYKGDLKTLLITGGIFHHDGYIIQDQAKRKEKQKRNMELLHKQLEKDPDNLIILTQCIESGNNSQETEGWLRRALVGIDEKWSQWALFGPPIYRYAVRMAVSSQMPELEEWIDKAETMFPDSIFVRVEIAYYAFGHAWNTDNYPEAIRWGEKYLQGVTDYHAGNFDRADLLASSLDKTDSHNYLSVATVLASGYLHEKQPEKCLRLMETFDGREMNGKQAGDCVRNLCNLYSQFDVDTAPLLLRLWDEINEPVPDQERADQRRNTFLQVGEGMFERSFVESEKASESFIHHAYDTFLPLAGSCELGTAAVMLETENPTALEELLYSVKELKKLPVQALYHAMEQGASFPLPEKPLNIEEMDGLAARLSQDKERVITLACGAVQEDYQGNWQDLTWARSLVMTAVRVFGWNAENVDAETGMALAQAFAKIEKEFLIFCYAPQMLCRKNLLALPSLHRFGWYCAQAFDALNTGDAAGYVHLLREGLTVCKGVKEMVEFLIDHTPELQIPPAPSDELRNLADQIRTILAAYPPDDPSVAAIKASEAYQKVAHLIEGVKDSSIS